MKDCMPKKQNHQNKKKQYYYYQYNCSATMYPLKLERIQDRRARRFLPIFFSVSEDARKLIWEFVGKEGTDRSEKFEQLFKAWDDLSYVRVLFHIDREMWNSRRLSFAYSNWNAWRQNTLWYIRELREKDENFQYNVSIVINLIDKLIDINFKKDDFIRFEDVHKDCLE